jgi:hypothetical protein
VTGVMPWISLIGGIVLLYVLVVWPLTSGRHFFTRDTRKRAREVAAQAWAGRPDDGVTNVPFDPVVRGRSLQDLPEDVRHPDDSGT